MARMGLFLLLAMVGISISAQLVAGQAPAPDPGCTNELVELLPCLDFLTNQSVSTVVPACCGGLTNASANPFCLCTLITGNQTAALGVNDTRALQLPALCGLSLNSNRCVAILSPTGAPVPASGPTSPVPTSAAPVSLAPAPVTRPPISSPESSAPSPLGDCNGEIISLEPCLEFVIGTASSPSSVCCTSLDGVVKTNAQCLCTLATSGTGTMGVNATLVQELPGLCHVSLGSLSISSCANVGAPSSPGSEGPGGTPPGGYGTISARTSRWYLAIAVCLATFAHAVLY